MANTRRRAPAGPPPRLPEPGPEPRYTPLARIAEGGMGEVCRARDNVLGREVAQKTLLWEHLHDEELRARFAEEIRIAASLEHPGIPPVHDAGQDAAGRPYLVMREVRGSTLRAALEAPALTFPELWRRVAVLHRAVEAVAFAHARGVIHGDLKPENVMIGAFGEVQVIDWGLARHVHEGGTPWGLGTEGYLAPELDQQPPHAASDVFALGVMLREVLSLTPGPEELRVLADACVDRDPAARPADAQVLARRLAAWLDGSSRAIEADQLVDDATELAAAADRARAAGVRLREQAARELGEASPWEAFSAEKRRAWRTTEEAEERERVAREQDAASQARLEAALALVSTHPGAHAALASHARRELEAAEQARVPSLADWAERRLRAHDLVGVHARWLAGDGALSLETSAPTEVWLHRFILDDRRLVPVCERQLGQTPLVGTPLPRGAWLLELRGPGPSVQLPIQVGRQEHVAPPVTDPGPLWMPDALLPGERYVPAGWCRVGGDPSAIDASPARRVWIRGFIARAHPVANGEYVVFLNDLAGMEDVAPWVPRRTRADGGEGDRAPVYRRGESGVWTLPDDPAWSASTPVVQVSWHAAMRYARWYEDRTGQPWRLPHALEREKMARGADGRFWPWGDHEDPTWFRNIRATAGRPGRVSVDACPLDVSVYGVMGLAGNVRDWCHNAWERDPAWEDGSVVKIGGVPEAGALAEVRGGAWSSTPQFCRPAGRFANGLDDNFGACGFRLVRSAP